MHAQTTTNKYNVRIISTKTIKNFKSSFKNETWDAVHKTDGVYSKFNLFLITFFIHEEHSFPVACKDLRIPIING
jgi:hypothetical protein